jgi:hypothetical protein
MLTPATITVNFQSNYAGPHRICWRQCNVGAYVCTNIVDCVGGGNTCSAIITVMVDPESCDSVCFEGYIQATCNPEGSPIGQIYWSKDYVPNPACKAYAITCTNLVTPCGIITSAELGLNCNGTVRPDITFVNPSSSVFICNPGLIGSLPAGYTIAEDLTKCCYDCSEYSVTIDPVPPTGILDGSSMYYIDCATRELIKVDFTGSLPVVVPNFCAVTGSVSLQLTTEATGNVALIGAC